mmetsp:Transcript_32831/g.101804  ORF Transcript_32831/g.101804 Transcript_32831/m.101804 type:complete len:140 (-) Transcript_32831:19-438(-)
MLASVLPTVPEVTTWSTEAGLSVSWVCSARMVVNSCKVVCSDVPDGAVCGLELGELVAYPVVDHVLGAAGEGVEGAAAEAGVVEHLADRNSGVGQKPGSRITRSGMNWSTYRVMKPSSRAPGTDGSHPDRGGCVAGAKP